MLRSLVNLSSRFLVLLPGDNLIYLIRTPYISFSLFNADVQYSPGIVNPQKKKKKLIHGYWCAQIISSDVLVIAISCEKNI
jgi:hypothetical protein